MAALKRYYPLGRCESLNVRGGRCGCRVVYLTSKGTKRCRFHGGANFNRRERGLPIGQLTAEGKAAVTNNLRNTPTWRKHLENNRKALSDTA